MVLETIYRFCLVAATAIFFLYIIKFMPTTGEVLLTQPVAAESKQHEAEASGRSPAGLGSATVYMGFTSTEEDIRKRSAKKAGQGNKNQPGSQIHKSHPDVTNEGYDDAVDRVLNGDFLNQ